MLVAIDSCHVLSPFFWIFFAISVGKRDCPGCMLAMKAIKLIMVEVFSKYGFTFKDDSVGITYYYNC